MELSENDIICDLAETYHIYDYKALQPIMVAIFVCGLRDDSRIMIRRSGNKVSIDRLMMAKMTDNLSLLVWSKTEDGMNGINPPMSFMKILLGIEDNEITGFSSGEDFFDAWE